MRYRRLGNSGVKVSEIALGSWLTYGGYVEAKAAREAMNAAFSEGVNFFDTADVYAGGEAEKSLGEFLASVPRKDVFVATKCFFPTDEGPNDRGLSRKHVTESLAASLDGLGLTYVDLYQCHRYDPETPLEEVVETMTNLVRRGTILYWGVSMWTATQITRACALARAMNGVAPISNQPAYSLLDRTIEGEVVPVSAREGLSQVVFSPLAQGVLTGKYAGGRVPDGSRASKKGPAGQFIRRFLVPDKLEAVERLRPIAARMGITLSQLALSWCLRLPNVASVVMGASTAAQVKENVAASGVDLDPAMLEAIEEALNGPRSNPEEE